MYSEEFEWVKAQIYAVVHDKFIDDIQDCGFFFNV